VPPVPDQVQALVSSGQRVGLQGLAVGVKGGWSVMPVFADKMLVCERCGRSFVFTVTEQRKLAQSGVEVYEPRYCSQCRQEDEGQVKLIGEVKWFSDSKGYGFIRKADGEEIFVHYSGIVGSGFKTLQEGQRVEFRVEQRERGPQAVDVVVLS